MPKVVLSMAVSVDGFFEALDGDISWHAVDTELHAWMNDSLRHAGAFIEGRRTYQLMTDYWPTADQDPGAPEVVRDFAAIWRSVPKYVYSTTLTQDELDANATVVHALDVASVRALKAAPGGDLFIGGAALAAAFLEHDLIDEFAIYVHPVVLGTGRPLFLLDRRMPLRLTETRTFGNGVVLHRYVPAVHTGPTFAPRHDPAGPTATRARPSSATSREHLSRTNRASAGPAHLSRTMANMRPAEVRASC